MSEQPKVVSGVCVANSKDETERVRPRTQGAIPRPLGWNGAACGPGSRACPGVWYLSFGGRKVRKSIKLAVGSTVQDLVNLGNKTSFTKKELDSLGIKIPEIYLNIYQIKDIRKKLRLSQTVFAQLLNVSPSSIRQWEQGTRQPTGSTKVLLELLQTTPHLLDYRLKG